MDRQLTAAVPELRPFGSNHYASVRVVLDWDHRLPIEMIIMRVYAAYSGHEARALDTRMRAREQAIDADNLYPEFDLPDYGELEASEAYAGVIKPGSFDVHDFRFFSPWRKEVRHSLAREAVSFVKPWGAADVQHAVAQYTEAGTACHMNLPAHLWDRS